MNIKGCFIFFVVFLTGISITFAISSASNGDDNMFLVWLGLAVASIIGGGLVIRRSGNA